MKPSSPTPKTSRRLTKTSPPSPRRQTTAAKRRQPKPGPTRVKRRRRPRRRPTRRRPQRARRGRTARRPPRRTQKKNELPLALFAGREDAKCRRGEGVDTEVGEFTLRTVQQDRVTPSLFRGRVMLLNFWGTWCEPCLEELPQFERLYRHYRASGLSLVAVATDEDPSSVAAFAAREGLKTPLVYGGADVAESYGPRPFPFTLVVGGDGVIREVFEGYEPQCLAEVEASVRQALTDLSASSGS